MLGIKKARKFPFGLIIIPMTYNNEQIFNTLKPVWHDAPFSLNRLVKKWGNRNDSYGMGAA